MARSIRVIAWCALFALAWPVHSRGVSQSIDDVDAEARRAFSLGQYERAADLAKRVYEMRRAAVPSDELAIATAAFNVGRVSRLAQRHEDAARYFGIACDAAAALSGENARLGSCLLALADALAAAKKTNQAKDAASRALVVIQASFPPDSHTAAVFRAGEIFRDAGEHQTALEYFQLTTTLYETLNLNKREMLVASLSESGTVLHKQRRYADAALLLERAASLAGESEERPNARVASRRYLLADCYREIGEYEKALRLLDQVAGALSAVDVAGHTGADDILLEVADLQYKSGGSRAALATVQEVLERSSNERSVAERRRSIRALELAGRAHASLSEYDEGEQRFKAAVRSARKAEEGGTFLSEALTELGFFLLRRGRYAESRAHFNEAMPIVEKLHGRESPGVARLLEQLAVGLINQNDCAAARPMIDRARTIYSRHAPASAEMVRALKTAAMCGATKTRRSALISEALRLQQKLEGDASIDWLIDSASFSESQGDLAKATTAVERALALNPANRSARELLARIWDKGGRHADAARLLRDEIPAVAASYGEDSINVAGRRFDLARTLLRAGDLNAARESFLSAARDFSRHTEQLFTLLSLAEQQHLLTQQTAVQISGILSVCQSDPCLAEGYSLMIPWKGLVVDGLRRQNELVRSARAGAGNSALERLRKVRAQLALWASSREARPYVEWKARHDALTAEKEELERMVLASDPAVNPRSFNLQDLQSALRESEVLVDIYKFDQFDRTATFQATYAAVITSRTSAPRFVKIGTAKQVDALVARWILGVEVDRSEDAWAAIRKTVWLPLLRALPQGSRVARVSGEGDLVRIPWHNFTRSGPADSALDVVEVSSARSLVDFRSQNRAVDGAERVVIVGGVDYDAGRTPRTPGHRGMPFPPLQWTAREAQEIERMARASSRDATALSGSAATKNAVLERIKSGTFLHFATHGFVPDATDPAATADGSTARSDRAPLLDSGIALSGANVRDPVGLQNDGVLTAEEILDADMRRSKLVVLSACKSALGVKTSGQGILGLRSSLHAAGAHRIVMSLWSVDDEATELLMSTFYRKLWIEKKPLLGAFQEAQAKVRSIDRFRAPRFWAGWSIVDPE